jgi:hypothetical protein
VPIRKENEMSKPAGNIETTGYIDIVEEIDSPPMPPKKKFKIKIKIQKITKGKPSICEVSKDEIVKYAD